MLYTGILLRLLRVTVMRRTALYDICDIHLFAFYFGGKQHFIEQHTGFAYKRSACKVLGLAGSFAHKHHFGVFASLTENNVVPRL